MYVGHLGFALLARRTTPPVPLPALVLAAYAPDIVQLALRMTGIGDPDQIRSHTVPSVVLTALAASLVAIARVRGEGRARAAVVAALTVLSHLPADYLTGCKTVWPGGPRIGLELYGRPRWDFVVETGFVGLAALACFGPRLTSVARVAAMLAALLLVAVVQALLQLS